MHDDIALEPSAGREPSTSDRQQAGAADAAFAYGGERTASLVTPTWRAAAATVIGPSHVECGARCDDAAAAACGGEWMVAVVCDGAGSASMGGHGAAIAAAVIAEQLLAPPAESADSADSRVRGALVQARAALLAIAETEGVAPGTLATTVVGAVWGRRAALIFHLGDGAAIAFGRDNTILGVSLGRFSEYANETYFLTDDAWEESLQCQTLAGVESLLLMTDGVTPFALQRGEPKREFYEGVLAYLRREEAGKGAAALQRLLDSEAARAQVGDDKTLLWVQREEAADGTGERADVDR